MWYVRVTPAITGDCVVVKQKTQPLVLFFIMNKMYISYVCHILSISRMDIIIFKYPSR